MSALMLLFRFPVVALALALYGAGNGIGAVARGTVPLALFGAERYPVLMGRPGLSASGGKCRLISPGSSSRRVERKGHCCS
jgi:hypothetical protein